MTRAERNRKIIEAIDAETERALLSREAAREILIKDGIYTAKGKLHAEFGGRQDKKAKTAA